MLLVEAISAFREAEAILESREAKKLRAPNLQHALAWGRREHDRLTPPADPWERLSWYPEKGEPHPGEQRVSTALAKESPGPGEAVKALKARRASEKAVQDAAEAERVRREAKTRKAASRERRLTAKGLPQDYSQAPKK